jgi:signal transduction histidine kinase
MNVGPTLVVPLVGSHRVHGVLTLGRKRGRPSFTADDLAMAAGFANQAALALELADARAEKNRVALFDERDRIAADLHDQVIQRLFGTGLALQAVAAGLGPGRHTERILTAISDLDDTISQVRTTIFSLSHMPDSSPTGLRARALDVVADVGRALGFQPVIQFTGVLDTLAADLTDDLLAVLASR